MNERISQRMREQISEGIYAQRNAHTKGFKHVLQRADGAMISNKTCWWTFDIGVAMEANEVLGCYPEAALVPTEVARQVIVYLMTKALDELAT